MKNLQTSSFDVLKTTGFELSGDKMSGPKGYGYRVISEEERQRREQVARQARCLKLISQIKGLIKTLTNLGATYDFSFEVINQNAFSIDDEQLLNQETENLKSIIEDIYKAHRISDMKTELMQMIQQCKFPELILSAEDYIEAAEETSHNEESALTQALYFAANDIKLAEERGFAIATAQTYRTSSIKLSPEIFMPPSKRIDVKRNNASRKLQNVTNAISEIHDESKRKQACDRLMSITKLPDNNLVISELLLLENWLHSVLEAEEWAELAASEIKKIEHINTMLANKVRKMSVEVSTKDDYEELKILISETLAEYNRIEDAMYVQRALEEVLERMGFTLGEPFLITDYGEVGIATDPSMPGYGIRIQNNLESSEILTRIVSFSPTTIECDIQAECRSCSMVHSLITELEKHDVNLELVSEKQPGECRVEHYSDYCKRLRNVNVNGINSVYERTE